ncbi:Oxysterol-binding protein [Coprinellus micaceus]|uniref:Oxysterol-binding protein n=1 Tax=Coprinellus micaceus TaxID=71717 RepID=A0A4Y7TYP4_COPMI|nr:Oxysterol-binding protein [Coprinellus micaceus]
MMGLFSSASSTASGVLNRVTKPRGSVEAEDKAPSDTEPDDTSILDENEGSIIASLISQLRVGMDLSRVTFPTFVLEPRSMLERITDFMSHPDLIFGAEKEDNPEERFIRVLQYYLAGWHIKPKGVKKPYNPVLGEFFRCRYDYPDGSQGFYIAEQVSHHPPVSAFLYFSPANHVYILGELRPKSKFLGNSVATVMEGENRVTLLGRPDDGEYIITMPNMYARGILFGKMVLELGDTCVAKNEKNGLYCDLEFKTKGFFSGTYNAIAGKVRKNNTEIGEVTGRWSHTMEIKNTKTGKKRMLFDAVKDGQNICPKWVPPEDEQEPNESRRLWSQLTKAIEAKDMEWATDAKSTVEEAQREDRKRREEKGEHFRPRFFETKDGRWVPKLNIPKDPQAAIAAVQEWIFPSSSSFVHKDTLAGRSSTPLVTLGSTDLNGKLPPPIPLTAS